MKYVIKNALFTPGVIRYIQLACVVVWSGVYPDSASGETAPVDMVNEGVHWRCVTERGAIHIWAPFDFQRSNAGVVLFVHGYSVNVDDAWRIFTLAEQFRMSERNAVFIVPEAPSEHEHPVLWPRLDELRSAIRTCGIYVPGGSWVIIGHSGAYRTIQGWVHDRQIKHLILLDALYAKHEQFEKFLERPGTKMTLISTETSEKSLKFIENFNYAVKRDDIPPHLNAFTLDERRARLLYIKSQYNHQTIVTNKKVIPLTLRLTRLSPLHIAWPQHSD